MKPSTTSSLDSKTQSTENKSPTMKFMELKRPNVIANLPTEPLKSKTPLTPSELQVQPFHKPPSLKEKLQLNLLPLKTSTPNLNNIFPSFRMLLSQNKKLMPEPLATTLMP